MAESGFVFDVARLEAVETDAERVQMLFAAAGKYVDVYYSGISKKVNLSDAEKLAIENLGRNIPAVFDSICESEQLHVVCKALQLLVHHLGEFPVTTKFMVFFRVLFVSNIDVYQGVYEQTIRTLFNSKMFCQLFLESNGLLVVFINSIESNMAGRLVMSYHLFMTPCFVETLVENQAYSVVTHVFDTIRCSNMEPLLMFQLMKYMALFIEETGFQHQLMEMGFFDTFNEFFVSFDVTEVMKLYDILVMCKDTKKVDYEIVKLVCKMYHMESYGVDNMVKVLEHVREQKSIYLVCPEQFMPEKWFDDRVLTEKRLFNVFSLLLRDCLSVSPPSINLSVKKIVESLKPPVREGVLYEDAIHFFHCILEGAEFTVDDFNYSIFLKKCFIEPSVEIVLDMLNLHGEAFLPLLSIILGKMQWYSSNLLERIVTVSLSNNLNQKLVREQLSIHFSPSILAYFLKNLDKTDHFELLRDILPDDNSKIVEFFHSISGFDLVEPLFKDNGACERLLFFVSIGENKDCFFDEWLLKQDDDCPIFKLERELISGYVFKGDLLVIPSLLPLCLFPLTRCSEYHFYLIGRYALPVYERLKIGYDRIPFLTEIAGRYFPPASFLRTVQLYPKLAMTMIAKPSIPFAVFEFIPGCTCYLDFSHESICSLGFFIRFESFVPDEYPFMTCNGVKFYIRDNTITDGAHVSVELQERVWHQIFFVLTKVPKSVTMYVDLRNVYSMKAQTLQLDCIGDREHPPGSLFYVHSRIVLASSPINLEQMGQYSLESKLDCGMPLNPRGCFRFAPSHSVKVTCCDVNFQFRIFEMFDNGTIETKKSLMAVIAAMPFILDPCNYGPYFERFLFSLEKCKEYNLDYLSCYVQAAKEVSDITKRTEILSMILMSWKILSRLSLDDFLEFQFQIVSKELLSMEIDWIFLAENHLFLFYWQLMCYFNEERATDTISVMLNFVAQFLDAKHLRELVDIAIVCGMWDYDIDITNWDCVPSLYDSFGQSHKMQEKMISLIGGMEHFHKTPLFTIDDLISISLSDNYYLAKTMFLIFLEVYKENAYMTDNVCFISAIVKRFYQEKEVFEAIMTLITGTNYMIDKDYATLSVKKPVFIPLLLSFLIAVNRSANSEYINNVYRNAFIVLENQSVIVGDNTQLIYLRELFRGGMALPSYNEPKVSDFSQICAVNSSKADQKLILEKVNQSQEHFAAILNKLVQGYVLDDPVPLVFLQFLSQLVIKWISGTATPTRIKKVLDFLVSEGRPSIVAHVLCGVFSHMSLNWNASRHLEAAAKVFCCREPAAFGSVFARLVALSEIPETMRELFPFLLEILDLMDTDLFAKYLKTINQHVETQPDLFSLKAAQIIIMNLIRTRVTCDEPLLGTLTGLIKSAPSDSIIAEGDDISTWKVVDKALIMRNRSLSQPKFEEFTSMNSKAKDAYNNFVKTMFSCVSRFVLKVVTTLKLAYKNSNTIMRNAEKRNAAILYRRRCSGALRDKPINSFRLAPFAGPDECNLVVLPSDMVIDAPTETIHNAERFVEDESVPFMNMKPITRISKRHPVNDDEMMFCASVTFASPISLMMMFAETFPDASDLKESCILVRASLRVPCVMFACGPLWRILTKAQISKNGSLELLPFDVSNNLDTALKEAVLMNEFGAFSMFCGHFVLTIDSNSVYFARKYVYAAMSNSYELFSATSGSFIVQFLRPTFIVQPVKMPGRIVETDWKQWKISTFRYLMYINSLANRSVNDLCAYPIMPRILFNYKEQGNYTWRDLSQPIDIAGDADPTHKMIMNCFAIQHYHHAENVSHPLYVSGSLSRLLPYCRSMWELNDGWDAGDRNFVAIERSMSIGPKTMYESLPELFALPESMININNFVLPNGKPLDMEFPSWCKDAFRFIEFQRELLESNEVRTNLHKWLDLMFGVDNTGEGAEQAKNVFNAMSYYDPSASLTPEELANKHQWMLSCGQVPFVVSTKRFEAAVPLPEFDLTSCEMKLKKRSESEKQIVRVDKYNESISCVVDSGQVVKYPNTLGSVVDVYVSPHQKFFAVTTSADSVMVFSYFRSVLNCISRITVESPSFSVLFDSQMLCYTACLKHIIVWSFAHGSLVNTIDLPNVTAMNVCRDRACLFAASGSTIYQYSLNGTFLRKIDVESKITVIESFGFEMFHSGLLFVAGTVTGDALIVELDKPTSEMILVSQKKMAHSPIKSIEICLNDGTVYITA